MKKLLITLLLFVASIAVVSCDITGTTTVAQTTEQTTQTTIEETTQTTVSQKILTGITLTNQSTKFLAEGADFDFSTLEITATYSDSSTEVIDSNLLTQRGFNPNSLGEQSIFVLYESSYVEVDVFVLADYAVEMDMEYYASALNLQGQELKNELYNILHDGFVGLLYGDARDILQESDEDPNNPDNIILIYTAYSVDSTWDGGATWNREHVWPQSRLGDSVSYTDDVPSIATDIHNLKPADPDENASRSNDYFGRSMTSDLYAPRAEVRGDIARILFYMATMYYGLSLDDDATTDSFYRTMGTLSILLDWNEEDPVDDFERNRNNVLYSYQGNRNPFIDYPELANLIWNQA